MSLAATRNHWSNFDVVVVSEASITRDQSPIADDEVGLAVEFQIVEQTVNRQRSLYFDLPPGVTEENFHEARWAAWRSAVASSRKEARLIPRRFRSLRVNGLETAMEMMWPVPIVRVPRSSGVLPKNRSTNLGTKTATATYFQTVLDPRMPYRIASRRMARKGCRR
jgi:hypothetical protein